MPVGNGRQRCLNQAAPRSGAGLNAIAVRQWRKHPSLTHILYPELAGSPSRKYRAARQDLMQALSYSG